LSELWLPPEYRKPQPGRNAPGIVEKVVYFENRGGHIILAVTHNSPTPTGYIRKDVNTPVEIAKLSKRYGEQKQQEFGAKDALTHIREERRIGQIIDRLRQRRQSADCKPFERDFIEKAIKVLYSKIDAHKSVREYHFHQEAYEAGTVTE
jgi:hypothetical protein